MTNEQFSAYLSDESYLYTVGYEELKTHVMNYPYSANLRILLLKKSLLEKNKDIDRNTVMAATYTTDRRELSKLVKRLKNPIKISENVVLGADFLELTELSSLDKVLAEKTIPLDFVNTRTTEKTFESLTTVNIIPEKLASSIKYANDSNTADFVNNMQDLAQYISPEIESVNNSIALSTEKETPHVIEKTEGVITEINAVSEEKKPEDDLILYHSVSLPDKNEEIPFQLIQMKSSNSHGKLVNSANEKPIEMEIINADKTIIKESPQSNSDTETKLSFTSWLKQFRVNEPQHETEILEKSETILPVSEKIKESIPEVEVSEQSLYTLQLKENLILRSSKKAKFDNLAQLFESTDNIPDNLFEPNEKKNIETGKSDSSEENEDKPINGMVLLSKTNMHDLAVKSITQNDDILSETLADIHLKQGNFAKAVEMYERLILQNPEKSVYFAAKIKGITVQEKNY